MPLVEGDVKGLEWVAINYLSQDPIGCKEIIDRVDQHGDNQKRFNLPTRVIAKIFVFRLIYGGSAWSYANDPEFVGVSRSEFFWQGIINEFYDKYKGIYFYHQQLMNQAITTGKVIMPTGREYDFTPYPNKQGGFKWPRTKILNYPVQGLGADLVSIIRVSLKNKLTRLRIPDILLVSTVHDSIIVDTKREYISIVAKAMREATEECPRNFEKLFGIPFNLPMMIEIKVGPNLRQMEEFNAD